MTEAEKQYKEIMKMVDEEYGEDIEYSTKKNKEDKNGDVSKQRNNS